MKRIKAILCALTFVFVLFAGCSAKADNMISADITLLTWNIFMASADTDALSLTLDGALTDIFTFQECTPEAYENVVNPFVRRNAAYKIACRKIGEKACRTPILFNEEKLTLVFSGTEVFRESYQGSPSKSAAYCVFTDKSGDKSFIVINMHGAVTRNKYAGYEDYTQEELAELAVEWRKGNVRQVKEIVDRLFNVYGELPVIMAGDCNFAADSEPYKIITSYGFKDKVAANTKSTHEVGLLPTEGKAIDHVFINDGFKFSSYEMLTDRTTLLASDHCPILAGVAFCNS